MHSTFNFMLWKIVRGLEEGLFEVTMFNQLVSPCHFTVLLTHLRGESVNKKRFRIFSELGNYFQLVFEIAVQRETSDQTFSIHLVNEETCLRQKHLVFLIEISNNALEVQLPRTLNWYLIKNKLNHIPEDAGSRVLVDKFLGMPLKRKQNNRMQILTTENLHVIIAKHSIFLMKSKGNLFHNMIVSCLLQFLRLTEPLQKFSGNHWIHQ